MIVAITYMDETEVAPLTSQPSFRLSGMHDLEFFPPAIISSEVCQWKKLSSVIFVVILPRYIPEHCEDHFWSIIIWVKPYR